LLLVHRLYEFSRSHPWPEYWLQEIADRFHRASESADELFDAMFREVERELAGAKDLLQAALNLCDEPGGPEPYRSALLQDMELVGDLLEVAAQRDWNLIRERLQAVKYPSLKACRGNDYDRSLVELAKELRNHAKNSINGLR